ncbi:hypothetical protein [Dongia rigui]|uniref:Poly(3-hydroxyalkanoate) polymerase subunit PhaE n=1 Tax=Dongia rigui TaxID=940149 RepID=A0ABU5E073_9PROT|nr:hypothetical protein [Dongia rigui]MDY0872925.1 hypothetical protein [Dongia rigui]
MTDSAGKQGTAGEKPDSVPELDELARRLLDLWQDQLSAVAANPDLAAQAARLMAAMPLPGMWLSQLGQMGQAGGSGDDLTKAWTRMTKDWMAQDWWKGTAHGSANGDTAPSSPAGAAPAAAASQPRGSDLDELGRRLAGIEQRLAELADGKPKRSPAAKPRTAAAKPRRSRAAAAKSGSGGPDGGAAG